MPMVMMGLWLLMGLRLRVLCRWLDVAAEAVEAVEAVVAAVGVDVHQRSDPWDARNADILRTAVRDVVMTHTDPGAGEAAHPTRCEICLRIWG